MEANIYQNSRIATYDCALIDVTPVDGISVVVTEDKVVVYEGETISMEYRYNTDGVDARRYAFRKAEEMTGGSKSADSMSVLPIVSLFSALFNNFLNSLTAWRK